MQIEFTKDGMRVTHETGLVITHGKAQLQSQLSSIEQNIMLQQNEALRVQGYITEIDNAASK